MKIEIISGSPRTNSVTRRLALHLQQYLQANWDHEVGIIDMRDWELPSLQKVFVDVQSTPERFKSLSERVFAADAFILVTPEYNGSYAPALKNLLDHYPKQAHKVFGIATASTGAMGGMRATQQLLLLVPALYGVASPYMLVVPAVDKKFDEEGLLLDPAFEKNVKLFAQEFVWLTEKVRQPALTAANS
jgi:NAD(P)H-dependent FMN reductase